MIPYQHLLEEAREIAEKLQASHRERGEKILELGNGKLKEWLSEGLTKAVRTYVKNAIEQNIFLANGIEIRLDLRKFAVAMYNDIDAKSKKSLKEEDVLHAARVLAEDGGYSLSGPIIEMQVTWKEEDDGEGVENPEKPAKPEKLKLE